MVKRIRYKGQIYEAVENSNDYKSSEIIHVIQNKNVENRIKKLGWGYVTNAYGNKDYYVAYGEKGKYDLLSHSLKKNKRLIYADPYDYGNADDGWAEYIYPYSNKVTEKLAKEILDHNDETRFISDANEKIDLGNNFFAYRAD